MEWYWTLANLMLPVIFVGALGVPVAFAFLSVNIVGAYLVMGGEAGVMQTVLNASQSITTFSLTPVIMFLLMGDLFFRTGLAPRVFDAVEMLVGGLPGRLALVAIGGGTIFAALSGSSVANAAMMSSTLAPAMHERKYKPKMIFGPIMGAGCLAALIPPSGIGVLLASLAQMDIGRLLIAGIVPGLLVSAAYMLLVIAQTLLDPDAAPMEMVEQQAFSKRALRAVTMIAPMIAILVSVIGTILTGLATPTESAAYGVAAVIAVALYYKKLSFSILFESLKATAYGTSVVLIILFNSATFSQILAYTGASSSAVSYFLSFDMSSTAVIVVMIIILLVLGMFIDQVSMMMISFPIFLPVVHNMGIDLIWFGAIVLITLEVALLTPPFGLLLFLMQGTAPPGITFGDVVRSALPYIWVQLLVLAAIVTVPSLATWLPGLM